MLENVSPSLVVRQPRIHTGQMHLTATQSRLPVAQGHLPCPRGLQRVRLGVRASSEKSPGDGTSVNSPARESIQARIDRARQYGKKPTGETPQLSELKTAPVTQSDTSPTQEGPLRNRDPRLTASSFQPAAVSPAQSGTPASSGAANQPSLGAAASAAAAAPDVPEQEDALLRQVEDFGATWAEKQQQQFMAAQAQLAQVTGVP